MRRTIAFLVFCLAASGAFAGEHQVPTNPTGTCGGDLGGTFPDCTVDDDPSATTLLTQAATEDNFKYETSTNRYFVDVNQDGVKDSGEAYVNDAEVIRVENYATLTLALAACPGTLFQGRCLLVLPAGSYDIGNIVVGSLTSTTANNSGVHIRGAGAGHVAVSGTVVPYCATTLNYTGAGGAGSISIDLRGTRFSSIQDLCIDGNGTLETAIRIVGDNATSTLSQGNTVQNVSITDITGTGVLLTGTGADLNDQVDHVLIDNLRVYTGGAASTPTYCVRQVGGINLALNVVRNLYCPTTSVDGVLNADGGLKVLDSYFGDNDGASVRFTGDGSAMFIEDNRVENDTGHGFVSEYGTSAGLPTSRIVGNYIALAADNKDYLDWNHRGALELGGNLIGTRGGTASTRGWRITPGAATLALTEGQDSYAAVPTFERDKDDIETTRGLRHATDCTGRTRIPAGEICYEDDADTSYACEASDGTCDAAADWVRVTADPFAVTKPVADSTAHTNTVSEAAFSNCAFTVPANTVAAGWSFRITAGGIISTDAVTPQIALRVRWGAGAGTPLLLDFGPTTAALGGATSDGWNLDGICTVRTIGATGTMSCNGSAGVPSAAGLAEVLWDSQNGETTINTTTGTALSVFADWTTADTDNTISAETCLIERVR